ncbi:MAG: ATP-binding protein, partial [Bacteroidota bacterium]|nr:ATP-binding protein [Bacteroidota bacterium]
RIMIYSLERDNMISCCVEDSGVGIEPNIVDDLFKHGEVESTLGTNGEKGTGLGLILCKELIQINKGEIRVKSKIDKGSTFCISLPINKT